MNHLTIAPGETWSAQFVAEVTEYMMVKGRATGTVRWGLLDSEKRPLGSGYALGTMNPPFSFGGGTPMRPMLPFYVTFKNESLEPISVSYHVYGYGRGSGPRLSPHAAGCAPGCLLVALGLAVPVVGWLL